MNSTASNFLYNANIELPLGAVSPDTFSAASGPAPTPTFVISRTRLGVAVSLFWHLYWDFSVYNREGRPAKLFFSFWGDGEPNSAQLKLSLEVKQIIFCLIWRKDGAPLSFGTLQNYLSVLNTLARYSHEIGATIGEVLGSESAIWDFVINRCSGWMTETLTSLLPHLAKFGADALGFDVVNSKCIDTLKVRNIAYRQGIKQHAPMPTRIYAHFLSGMLKALEEWLAVADDILNAARYCAQDPRAGRVRGTQRKLGRRQALPQKSFLQLKEVLNDSSIQYFKNRGKTISVKSLTAILGDAQYIMQLIIQAFSGMREDEVNSVPYHCNHTTVHHHRTHHLIHGRTTKFVHGLAKKSKWVTNEEGHAAVNAAQKIADVIYDAMNVKIETNDERVSQYPLFIGVGYLGLVGKITESREGYYLPGSAEHRKPPSAAIANIEEGDLLELEQIDPHRAWRTEPNFQIGEPWNFTSHQLRRSLGLYAQKSGLVSLPSLRRQLKQITDDMALYYANGSAFAKDFLGEDKEHFGFEWQKIAVESAALSYWIKKNSGEVFKGGHGSFMARRAETSKATVLEDRNATFRMFKNGEIAFRETVLGGCTNNGPCDRVGVQWLPTACVTDNCKNLVCSKGKLERVIAAQTVMVNSLAKDSMEFRTDASDLQAFIKFLEQFDSK